VNDIPLAKPKLFEFTKVPAVILAAKTPVTEALFVKIVGKANVEHLQWVIGNYWEQKISRLDTDALYEELRILFHSKRRAKRTMNETRDEIASRVIECDWGRIWKTFKQKVERCLWKHPKTKGLVAQTIQLHGADLVIEENSTCEVHFEGKGYTVDIEGRRSIVGNLTSVNRDKTRVMNVKNRFVGRTFWQCQGRSHVVYQEK
jgi:hypothetical protein